MRYGHFDDQNREYVIETPHTPLPWINYLGVDDFHSLISNTLGGYSFYKDAKLRRLTRYRYNNVPEDVSGRFFYIKDEDTVFNAAYLPTKTELDSYECHVGLGYNRYRVSKNDIQVDTLAFVPLHDPCEINKVTLTNNSKNEKHIQLYAAVEFCLYNAIDDANNYQRNLNIIEVEVDENTIFHKTEYRERRNHYCFFYGSDKHDGFDTDRNIFIGRENGFDHPEAIAKGTSYQSIVSDCYPLGCHRYDITLKPGESKTLIFLLGYVENNAEEKFIEKNIINKEKAYALMKKYREEKAVDAAFEELKQYWSRLLSTFSVHTDHEKVDRMANIWNQYQCMITYLMSRSASYFETGTGRGMGFRDSCQDLLGFVHLIPERARERIIDIASIQFKDGSTYHQYQPLTKRGNADIGSGFNDDPLWLVGATIAYIKETGDYSILSEPVPFDNEKGSEKSLYDHLLISLDYTITHLGPHHLPLIGRADWNDCLNLNCFSTIDGESFQTVVNHDSGTAESIFIAGMFVKYGKEFIDLANHIHDEKNAKRIQEAVAEIEKATVQHGYDYDGDYFMRAYDAFSHEVGSSRCEEGKIFIEPQGFCALAGIGKEQDLPKRALKSVLHYLMDDYGLELLYPPYSSYHVELGEISSYPPGNKENGSVFCHNNPWVTLALAKEGMREEAFDLYKKAAPSYLEDKSEIHQTEPYVYSQTIAGRFSSHYGRAKNSWLTGTASWSFVALSEGIFGIEADFDGLRVNPMLSKEFKHAEITRIFRGKKYHITVDQTIGKKSYIVNGKEQNDTLIRFDDSDSYEVLITE